MEESKGLAVVTGASSGIGYELAKVFAEHGFNLLVAAEDGGIAEAATAFKAFGHNVDFVQVNLAQTSGVEVLYRRIHLLNQPVEVLCLNAGVGVGGEFAENSIEEEVNLVNLNVLSPLRLVKLVLKDMIQQGHGRILFTSSLAAEMPGPYYAVYAASKAFIQSFAQALRIEVLDKNITVTALQPGATDTDFFERAHMIDTKVGQAKKDDPADVARDGYNAVMDGKDHVVAGSLMNRVAVVFGKFMTESQGAKNQSRHTKPNAH
jgi:uncharacterized protein